MPQPPHLLRAVESARPSHSGGDVGHKMWVGKKKSINKFDEIIFCVNLFQDETTLISPLF
jgi:hypothetical protein